MKPYLSIKKDGLDQINKTIASFKRDDVLVGIPAEDSNRNDTQINNATLLFINNFGSPMNNIPPRPVMQIGLFIAQDAIAEEFKKAAQSALKNGVSALSPYYNRIGMIASNAIKRVINEQIGIDPPAESTIAGRQSRGFNGTKSLVVSGQMRNSITYVVKGE